MINELEDSLAKLYKAGARVIHIQMRIEDYHKLESEIADKALLTANERPYFKLALFKFHSYPDAVSIYKSVELPHSCIVAVIGGFLLVAEFTEGKAYLYDESTTAKVLRESIHSRPNQNAVKEAYDTLKPARYGEVDKEITRINKTLSQIDGETP